MGKLLFLPLKSILAKRMFTLFMVCNALPLIVIALVADFHVRRYLETRISRELRATSRVYETVVFDILLLFENQFLGLLPGNTAALYRSGSVLETEDEDPVYFLHIARLADEKQLASPLSAGERDVLSQGRVLFRHSNTATGEAALSLLAFRHEHLFHAVANLDYLRERIADYGEWGRVHLAILRGDGTPVAGAIPSSELAQLTPPSSPYETRFDLVGEVAGEPCVGVVNTIFLMGRFGVPNWRLIMMKPQSEAFAPLVTFRRTFFLMLLIAVVAICLFMLISIRRYTRQIDLLEEGTEKIRNHDFGHAIALKSGDEFERLGQAFNTMTRSLRDYQQDLARQNERLREQMVEIRQAREKEKVMLTQLARAEHLESLGQLAGGVAHDFTNLLSVIVTHAEMTGMELPENSPLHENLDHINTASQKATELCRQMMVYAGDGTYAFEPVDLAQTIRDIGDLMRASVGKNIALVYEMDDEPIVIDGDASQILQVVLNFITNAATAIGNGQGRIVIRLATESCPAETLRSTYLHRELPDGRYARLEVADTGCGMESDIVNRIFDPFFTTKETGHGLGLATVLGIINAHCGTVRVASQPGKGTTFTVFLPLLQADETPPSAS